MPACHDCLSAVLIQRSGFEVAVSATQLALPDAGLISYDEQVSVGRSICEVTRGKLLVIGDGDTGFGGSGNIMRMIRGYAGCGFAGITIEDQCFPKHGSFARVLTVEARDVAVERVRAAVAARDEMRRDDGLDLLIIGRTDCRNANVDGGLEEAIARCKAFAAAGAEVVHASGLAGSQEMRLLNQALADAFPGTLTMLTQVERTDKTLVLSVQGLEPQGLEPQGLELQGLEPKGLKPQVLEPHAAWAAGNKGAERPAPAEHALVSCEEAAQLGYTLNLMGLTVLSVAIKAMKEALAGMATGHTEALSRWEDTILCDGYSALSRADWLMTNRGLSERDARLRVMHEFPGAFRPIEAAAADASALGKPSLAGDSSLGRLSDVDAADLIWSDEFDYEGPPDPSKWGYDVGGGGWGNDELQLYTTSTRNAVVSDGVLRIHARREGSEMGGAFTSARLVSRDRAEFTHARVDVRLRLPAARGSWPAVWMLPVDMDGGWPRCGELDIMEHVGHDLGAVHGTIHTEAFNHMSGSQVGRVIGVDAPGEWHTYSVVWSEEGIDWAIDGLRYHRFKRDAEGGVAAWPFDKPFYLILNLAVGGAWGGQRGIDREAFDGNGQVMEVDSVRVYRVPGGAHAHRVHHDTRPPAASLGSDRPLRSSNCSSSSSPEESSIAPATSSSEPRVRAAEAHASASAMEGDDGKGRRHRSMSRKRPADAPPD